MLVNMDVYTMTLNLLGRCLEMLDDEALILQNLLLSGPQRWNKHKMHRGCILPCLIASEVPIIFIQAQETRKVFTIPANYSRIELCIRCAAADSLHICFSQYHCLLCATQQ